jgi:hypothetical protein
MGLISQYIVKGVLHFYLYLKYLISDPAIQMSIDDHIKVFPPHAAATNLSDTEQHMPGPFYCSSSWL